MYSSLPFAITSLYVQLPAICHYIAIYTVACHLPLHRYMYSSLPFAITSLYVQLPAICHYIPICTVACHLPLHRYMYSCLPFAITSLYVCTVACHLLRLPLLPAISLPRPHGASKWSLSFRVKKLYFLSNI